MWSKMKYIWTRLSLEYVDTILKSYNMKIVKMRDFYYIIIIIVIRHLYLPERLKYIPKISLGNYGTNINLCLYDLLNFESK